MIYSSLVHNCSWWNRTHLYQSPVFTSPRCLFMVRVSWYCNSGDESFWSPYSETYFLSTVYEWVPETTVVSLVSPASTTSRSRAPTIVFPRGVRTCTIVSGSPDPVGWTFFVLCPHNHIRTFSLLQFDSARWNIWISWVGPPWTHFPLICLRCREVLLWFPTCRFRRVETFGFSEGRGWGLSDPEKIFILSDLPMGKTKEDKV